MPPSRPLLDVHNALGAEGWELVAEDIRANASGRNLRKSNPGVGVDMYWTFKRPVG